MESWRFKWLRRPMKVLDIEREEQHEGPLRVWLGVYECVGTNPAGEDRKTAQLTYAGIHPRKRSSQRLSSISRSTDGLYRSVSSPRLTWRGYRLVMQCRRSSLSRHSLVQRNRTGTHSLISLLSIHPLCAGHSSSNQSPWTFTHQKRIGGWRRGELHMLRGEHCGFVFSIASSRYWKWDSTGLSWHLQKHLSGKPTIQSVPETKRIELGQSTQLECQTDGSPSPQIRSNLRMILSLQQDFVSLLI